MITIDDKSGKWAKIEQECTVLYFKGSREFAEKAYHIATQADNFSTALTTHLKALADYTSGIIETGTHIIAWVDHIRAWPLFYSQDKDGLSLSNNARNLLKTDAGFDEDSCLEFAMSGYVTGARTLCEDIKSLQPGEFLIWDKKEQSLRLTRYYRYLPDMTRTDQNFDSNIEKLGTIIDHLTQKIIQRAAGRPIWIPLSGGLDSRIILCKLHEHGYKNLHTFTYGPKFNFESKIAKKIAQSLNIPWVFITPSKKQIRSYFNSKERKDFWDNTDGLKAIPSMREFSALMDLRRQKLIPDDAIMINGQSGDYITGGHISSKWLPEKKCKISDLYNILNDKHYGLWRALKTPKNLKKINKRIATLIEKDDQSKSDYLSWATLEEIWEYDARQICLVANGQRSYDFFNYDWEMPLWEKELVDFCETLPIEQKRGQALYKAYLQDYNYKNLFPKTEPYIWRWPVPMLWVIPVAQIIRLVKGTAAKDNFYALMRYHGHYSNQFYSFPWKAHKKTFAQSRNVMSLNVREWAIENKNIFPRFIKEGMLIDDVD